ncbi:MAG: agmatinase, partial [Hyphomicrobiaceae bacterium]
MPRYTGVRTFARCPHVSDLTDVDAAVVGIPFDTATSYRPGARFGPEAIRASSIILRPYHPDLSVDVLGSQRVVDYGGVSITPGNAVRSAEQIADALGDVVRAGVFPVVLGGDHSIVLGELRAQAARHGPMSLVLLDAHADVWDDYYGERYFHGTPFRRAVEEGLVDPRRSILAGMRGTVYSEEDVLQAKTIGFEVIGCDDLRAMPPREFARRVRERVGEGPTFLSFDVDLLDPSCAPGTGTPE